VAVASKARRSCCPRLSDKRGGEAHSAARSCRSVQGTRWPRSAQLGRPPLPLNFADVDGPPPAVRSSLRGFVLPQLFIVFDGLALLVLVVPL
jgi:hypothetical protein